MPFFNRDVAMRISQLLKPEFGSDVRSRAGSYVHGRAVRIVQGTPTAVWATVQGSQRYNVALCLEDDELHISCSCPFFHDRGVGCKHIWATILVAEQQGHLSEVPRGD